MLEQYGGYIGYDRNGVAHQWTEDTPENRRSGAVMRLKVNAENEGGHWRKYGPGVFQELCPQVTA